MLGSVAGLALILLRVDASRRRRALVGHGTQRCRSRSPSRLVALAVRARSLSRRCAPRRPTGASLRSAARHHGNRHCPAVRAPGDLLIMPTASRPGEGDGALTTLGFAYLISSGSRRGDGVLARSRDSGAARPVGNRRRPDGTACDRVVLDRAPRDRCGRRDVRARGRTDREGAARLELLGRRRRRTRAARRGVRAVGGRCRGRLRDISPHLRRRIAAGPLPAIAIGAVALQLGSHWRAKQLFGLEGLALSLAVTTAVVLALLLAVLHALTPDCARPRARRSITVVVACRPLVRVALLLLPAVASAAVGLGVYGALFAIVRPPGLRSAWRYLRALA